ncbi:MAG: shikimate dehydrogenase, partial [Myxococcota bacterium]
GRRAVVLGAGGTARAAVFALRERGATVHVLNRTVSSAERLAEELGGASAGPLEALASLDHDVLVNTTSVGLSSDASPVRADALRSGTTVFDAVYDPPLTQLLRDARERGARIVPGKWMLVEQAVEQIQLWSGKAPPSEVLAEAFDAAAGR